MFVLTLDKMTSTFFKITIANELKTIDGAVIAVLSDRRSSHCGLDRNIDRVIAALEMSHTFYLYINHGVVCVRLSVSLTADNPEVIQWLCSLAV